MIKLFIRYVILVPLGLIFIPFFAGGLWMSPMELYKEFFQYLKTGEPLGVFD